MEYIVLQSPEHAVSNSRALYSVAGFAHPFLLWFMVVWRCFSSVSSSPFLCDKNFRKYLRFINWKLISGHRKCKLAHSSRLLHFTTYHYRWWWLSSDLHNAINHVEIEVASSTCASFVCFEYFIEYFRFAGHKHLQQSSNLVVPLSINWYINWPI